MSGPPPESFANSLEDAGYQPYKAFRIHERVADSHALSR